MTILITGVNANVSNTLLRRLEARDLLTTAALVLVPVATVALLGPLPELLRSYFGIDLPRLPNITVPDLDLTDVGLPAWLQRTLDSSDYVIPIFATIAIVCLELARRARKTKAKARRNEVEDS